MGVKLQLKLPERFLFHCSLTIDILDWKPFPQTTACDNRNITEIEKTHFRALK